MMDSKSLMDEAARLAMEGMKSGDGGPFAAVIVRNGEIVGHGWNQVFGHTDPTAHAEVQAIRNTCKELKTLELAGMTMYCTGEPCPMCMSAIYWSQLDAVYFANTKEESALCGFDDAKIYAELAMPWNARALSMVHFPNDAAMDGFRHWNKEKVATAQGGEAGKQKTVLP